MILLKSNAWLNSFTWKNSLDKKNLNIRSIPANFEDLVKPFDEMNFPFVGRVFTKNPTIDLYFLKDNDNLLRTI